MPLDVLQPPLAQGARPGALPSNTWSTTPQRDLLAAPFGASGVSPAVQQQQVASPGSGVPKLNTDREDEIRKELGGDKNPDAPKLDGVPKPPVYQQSDPFGGITPIVMLLGGLAAGKTRTPATTMLNSFAEFNKARAAGDAERAKTAHEAWKDAAQQVVDTNKDRLSTYKEILDSNKGDKRALEAELTSLISEDKLYAAMHKDDGSSIYTNVQNWADATGKATDKLSTHLDGEKAKASLSDDQRKIVDETGIDPVKVAGIKPEYRNDVLLVGTGKMLPSEIGRGKSREKVMQAVADVFGDKYDSGDIAMERKYKQTFASPSQVKTEQTLNSTIGHLHDLKDIIGKMTNTDLQKFNSMSQDTIKQLGSGSIYYQFNVNRNLLMEEAAKLYKGGTPAQAEIESLKGELFSSMSMDQMNQVLGQIARNLEDAGDAIGDVRARRTGQSEEQSTPYTGRSQERLQDVFKSTGVEGHHGVDAGPKYEPGEVVNWKDGTKWKFKGGDQHDQNNWTEQ